MEGGEGPTYGGWRGEELTFKGREECKGGRGWSD